jgi:hypothetical protein
MRAGHARPVGYEWLEPSGGRLHAPGSLWWLAAVFTTVAVLALLALLGLTVAPVWPRRVTRSRRAALLGAATGICWGFEAAIIKEFSSRIGDGLGAIVSNWSLYVLVGGGALTMLLASHAMAAGPLAVSQPGFTILDPLAASFLGVFLFGERVRTGLPAWPARRWPWPCSSPGCRPSATVTSPPGKAPHRPPASAITCRPGPGKSSACSRGRTGSSPS